MLYFIKHTRNVLSKSLGVAVFQPRSAGNPHYLYGLHSTKLYYIYLIYLTPGGGSQASGVILGPY